MLRWVTLILITACLAIAARAEERRLALVISQTEYSGELSRIAQAETEAGLVSEALQSVGFDVSLHRNLSRSQLNAALDAFRIRLEQAGPEAVGFVYYTGHGVQHPGSQDSYLLGVDASLKGASDLARYGIDMKSQRDGFAATGAKAVFMVFDACRNTPPVPGWKANVKGLSRVEAGADMLIAYATSLGDLAEEGVYAPILAEELKRPGQTAAATFEAVQYRIAQSTNRRQRPWANNQLYSRVCFAGCEVTTTETEANQKLRRRQVTGAHEALTLRGHEKTVRSISFSPDGSRIVTASYDKTAKVWDIATGRLLSTLSGHAKFIYNAEFSPDGSRIVTASSDKTAKLWDAASGRLLATLNGHDGLVYDAEFSPDGSRIVTASSDKTAKLWDATSGRLLATLGGHEDMVSRARFSPSGARVVTASSDKTAKVWDTASGQLLVTLRGHELSVYDAKFSLDGGRIVTASADSTAKVWSAASGRLLVTLTGDELLVYGAEFSPDGEWIVTALSDNTAKLWDAVSGESLVTLRGHELSLLGATFSPNGARVVTASSDSAAKVWDSASGQLLATLSGHEGAVLCATFSPDGIRIATASDDGTAKIWELVFGE